MSKKKHEFLTRKKNGKVQKLELNLDQYLYKIITATDIVLNSRIEELQRSTEDSRFLNPVRKAFYEVNDNSNDILLPAMFELNDELFENLKEASKHSNKL